MFSQRAWKSESESTAFLELAAPYASETVEPSAAVVSEAVEEEVSVAPFGLVSVY